MKKQTQDIMGLINEPVNRTLQLATPVLLVVFVVVMAFILNTKYSDRSPVHIVSMEYGNSNLSSRILLSNQYRNKVKVGQHVFIVAHTASKYDLVELPGQIVSIKADPVNWNANLQITVSLTTVNSKKEYGKGFAANGFLIFGYKNLADQFLIKKLIHF
jgi:hypothetical protein